jgi:hypothetical protein
MPDHSRCFEHVNNGNANHTRRNLLFFVFQEGLFLQTEYNSLLAAIS